MKKAGETWGVDKAKKILAEDAEKRARECADKIKAILAEYGMAMQPKISIANGNQIQVELSIVSIP